MSYQLYYTLNTNLQTSDLKKNEKEELLNVIKNMSDLQSKKALFLLICEHAKNEQVLYNNVIPYDGVEIKEDSVQFNLAKMPIKLRRIIYKFIKIVQKNEMNI